jgi:hypothetical protein
MKPSELRIAAEAGYVPASDLLPFGSTVEYCQPNNYLRDIICVLNLFRWVEQLQDIHVIKERRRHTPAPVTMLEGFLDDR